MTENSASPARLTRDTVLRAALELLDEVGIDALSTRKLAERLGVQSPTLYWHFKNKGELLHAMAERIMLERHGQSGPKRGQSWRTWMAANARSFRQALLAYRDGARLHAGTRPREAHFDAIEAKVRFLYDAGFTPEQSSALMMGLGRFVVGWVLEEQADTPMDAPSSTEEGAPDPDKYPLLARAWARLNSEDPDTAFERSLKVFLAGAEAMLKR